VTAIDGVAAVTVTLSGEVVGIEAKLESPPYVALAVYVPEIGVAIWQVYRDE
jgi:hypothetical protein